MILTPAQITAVNCNENNLIVACPGSGKTRTIISKMIRCLDEVRNTPHRIAVLTYTNTAVHEIEYRLWEYGRSGDVDFCDIATIHSFCLSNILNRFYGFIPEYEKGFTIIPNNSSTYKELVAEILESHDIGLNLRASFENLNRLPDGTPIDVPEVPKEVVISFWERLQEEGLIDFPNIIYYSNKLLTEFQGIGHALASKYKWILVDEFQDTSALQIEIFRAIEMHGLSKWFLVGDPLQSIFGFAGAVPELLYEFANEIGAKEDVKLLGNFRSSTNIIEHAEKLCPRDPPMIPAGLNADFGVEPQHIQVASYIDGITGTFCPSLDELDIPYGKSAIFAPWWFELYHLSRELRERGIPIFGPGSRPYKRTHLFARIAEQICAYITKEDARSFHQLEKELSIMLDQVSGDSVLRRYSFESRLLAQRLIRVCKEASEISDDGITWLELASDRTAEILMASELITEESAHLISQSAREMAEDMTLNKVETATLTIRDLGIFADSSNSINLLTLHKAKGREFDAVAIIDLHEGRIPDYRAIRANNIRKIEEGRRVFYVGITRARKYLLYITKEVDWNTKPSRFLLEDGLAIL